MGVVVGRGQVKKFHAAGVKVRLLQIGQRLNRFVLRIMGRAPAPPFLPPSHHPPLHSHPLAKRACLSYNGKRKGSRHQVFNAILETDVLINGTRWGALFVLLLFHHYSQLFPPSDTEFKCLSTLQIYIITLFPRKYYRLLLLFHRSFVRVSK